MRVWGVVLAGVVSVWALFGVASAGHKAQLLPPFEVTTQCMLGVLQTEPHVKNPTLVGDEWNGRDAPYIEYTFSDENVMDRVIRFTRRGDRNSVYFMAVLPGLVAPGDRHPPDYGAGHIAGRWKTECHVDANILTV